jgi:hypothetical protein
MPRAAAKLGHTYLSSERSEKARWGEKWKAPGEPGRSQNEGALREGDK